MSVASAAILQRVIVRMLHDPELRAAVYADPDGALGDLPLDASERRALVAPDPRAWGIDEHRADRVLAALLEEHPVAALTLLEEGVPLPRLHRFFQGRFFHDAIMARRSLAPAFAEHLGTLASSPRARAMVALEGAIASLRRSDLGAAEIPAGRFVRAPHLHPIALPSGTLAAWEKARKAIGDTSAAALVVRARRPKIAPVDPRTTEWVLLDRQGDDTLAGYIGEALGRLLIAAEHPVSSDRLVDHALNEGASHAEALEILEDLVGEGLLLSCR